MTEKVFKATYLSIAAVLIGTCSLVVGIILGMIAQKVTQKATKKPDTIHGFYYPKKDDTPITGRLINEDTIVFSPAFETLEQCSDWGLNKQKYGGLFQCAKNCVRLANPGDGRPFKCDD